jgi:hypothetical protein
MLNLPFGINNIKELYKNNESGPAGYYPIGTGNFWHGGIHINSSEKQSIKPIIPGVVITYRINQEYGKVTLPEKLTETEYNNLGNQDRVKYLIEDVKLKTYKIKEGLADAEKTKNVSNSFILMRHEYSAEQLQSGTLVFYSLYMNLAPVSEAGTGYYGEKFKTGKDIQFLPRESWFSVEEVGMPGLYGNMRYFEYVIITEKELFEYKEKWGLAEKDRKYLFYKIPPDVPLFTGEKETVSPETYYIPGGTTYNVSKEVSCDGETAKMIQLTGMTIYLSGDGMKYDGKKKSFAVNDVCEIVKLNYIWLGREIINLNGEPPEKCRYVIDNIRVKLKGLLNTKCMVTSVAGKQPGITLDFQKDFPCTIVFWSKENRFTETKIGSSQEFTVYKKNPLSYIFGGGTVSVEQKAAVTGFMEGSYQDDKGKEYRKTDNGLFMEESNVKGCMKSAFAWSLFFDKKTEPFGATEDIFCDRSELLRQIDTSGFMDNLLNGRRISRAELMRLYGPGENFSGTESIRENMRKVVCKHPIEWDGEQFRNIKNLYDKKSPFGHMSKELAAELLKMAQATDLWAGGLKNTFGTNNLNFVHPAYFLNHLDKAGIIGGAIVKFDVYDTMSKYNNDEKDLLGNSSTELISEGGCYITTYSNMFYAAEHMNEYYLSDVSKYDGILKINNDKNLFVDKNDQDHAGSLRGDAALKSLFGSKGSDWIKWGKDDDSRDFLLNKLKELDSAGRKCMVAGIFDLSSYNSAIKNHMVGIGGLPNEKGVFQDSIIVSSDYDKDRLQYFTVNHLKEIVVVYLKKK